MKTVLKRAEEINKNIAPLNLKKVSLLNVKIATLNPSTGSFRIKGIITEESFIELFEFLYAGEILKYSYVLVKNQKSLLRYDNAPHHKEITTHPHHKHVKDNIFPLPNHHLDDFIREILEILQ